MYISKSQKYNQCNRNKGCNNSSYTCIDAYEIKNDNNASSVVDGIKNSDTENLIGSANFSTLSIALMEKSTSNENETICACLFRLGKRLRTPLPIIAPCSKPTPKTVANVIKKFCSAKSNIFKSYPLQYKIKMLLILVITD